ncbi:radical SAM protein [Candidatus Poribacteria bacterium]|nr:radical SAM protein [Candidatus Poribacteria bacterium]
MEAHPQEILLINPNLMKPPVTPVAIDFLASALKRGGYTVRFLDLAFENNIDLALRRELKRDLLFVGVTIRNVDDSFFATRDFCLMNTKRIILGILNYTHAPIVLGGVGYSIFPAAALEYCGADYGIRGDGEEAIVRLADALAKNEDPTQIPGLVWKRGRKWQVNDPAPVDLSMIDLSDRSTVDNRWYFKQGGMVGFETKRGCNASCSYCADPLAKGAVCRLRPPEQVAREVFALADSGITHFHTCDSEFNMPRRHAADVCREFIHAHPGKRIRWYAYMTPANFDDELASLMKRAGCAGIDFGADHCNEAMLKTLGRKHTANSIAEAARLCRVHKIPCMFDLLLGAPGETPETVREAVEFMKRIDPSCVGASLGMRLYPGTALARALGLQNPPSESIPPFAKGGTGGFTAGTAESVAQSNLRGIHGLSPDNHDFLRPVFFVSPQLGENPESLLFDLVKGDERFFVASPERGESDYNYNDNSVLSEAIRAGERGAFWDILRRLKLRSKSG